jgi:hypothetical protein
MTKSSFILNHLYSLSLFTFGYSKLATTSLVRMRDIVTKGAFKWLFSDPEMIRASAVVG